MKLLIFKILYVSCGVALILSIIKPLLKEPESRKAEREKFEAQKAEIKKEIEAVTTTDKQLGIKIIKRVLLRENQYNPNDNLYMYYYCINNIVYFSYATTDIFNPLIKNTNGEYWDCDSFIKEKKS